MPGDAIRGGRGVLDGGTPDGTIPRIRPAPRGQAGIGRYLPSAGPGGTPDPLVRGLGGTPGQVVHRLGGILSRVAPTGAGRP